jgi:hypothetical protein
MGIPALCRCSLVHALHVYCMYLRLFGGQPSTTLCRNKVTLCICSPIVTSHLATNKCAPSSTVPGAVLLHGLASASNRSGLAPSMAPETVRRAAPRSSTPSLDSILLPPQRLCRSLPTGPCDGTVVTRPYQASSLWGLGSHSFSSPHFQRGILSQLPKSFSFLFPLIYFFPSSLFKSVPPNAPPASMRYT